MSIAFGKATKDADDNVLHQALKAMRKIGAKRRNMIAMKRLSKRRYLRKLIYLWMLCNTSNNSTLVA